jgi:hypothetical protein
LRRYSITSSARKGIETLIAAARKSSRYGHRDATMILIAYRHGRTPRRYAICKRGRADAFARNDSAVGLRS